MNPTITKLALEWLRAERRAPVEFGKMVAADARIDQREEDAKKVLDSVDYGAPATADEMANAIDRVYHVLRGEVRWSETSPGDKAVWRGRLRDAERFEVAWRGMLEEMELPADDPPDGPIIQNQPPQFPNMLNYPTAGGRQAGVYEQDGVVVPRQPPARAGGPRLVGYRTREWWNYYDTLTFGRTTPPRPTRLFGNENIGDPFLTNCRVPGQIRDSNGDYSCQFWVFAFYVHATDMDALRWAADHVQFTFCIGGRPHTPPMFVRDLFIGIQLRRPLLIPERQNFSCAYEWDDRFDHRELDEFQISFHIDGLITSEVSVSPQRRPPSPPPIPPPPLVARARPAPGQGSPPRTIRPSRPRPSPIRPPGPRPPRRPPGRE